MDGNRHFLLLMRQSDSYNTLSRLLRIGGWCSIEPVIFRIPLVLIAPPIS